MQRSTAQSIDPNHVRRLGQVVAQRCDALAKHSDRSDCLARTFCSPAMASAHAEIARWMTDAGMTTRVDAVGNLIGTYRSQQQPPQQRNPGGLSSPSEAPVRDTFMIGSHLDSVVNAGRFDGMLGCLLGLGVVQLLQSAGVRLPFDLEVIGFSEEEGVRYGFPFIGSRGVTGTLDPADLQRLDDDQITISQALRDFGCDVDRIDSASYFSPQSSRRLIGFLETHLEQATGLERSARPVAVVSAIAGQSRASILMSGVAGHAGTMPHDQRVDALAAAAQLILRIEQLGQTTDGLFASVGRLLAIPNLSNVISGETVLSLDLRHASDTIREQALATVGMMLLEIQKDRGVVGSITSAQHSPAVPMDPVLKSALHQSIHEVSDRHLDHPRSAGPEMVSGAGHDAMILAAAVPSCMLFVRCKDGISHHPDEFVSPADITIALEVMTRAVLRVAASYQRSGC